MYDSYLDNTFNYYFIENGIIKIERKKYIELIYY